MGKVLAVLDAGNTRLKCAIFDNQRLKLVKDFPAWDPLLVDFIHRSGAQALMVSSVIHLPAQYAQGFAIPIHVLDSQYRLPLVNSYETPQTLGPDRLANACGAWVHHNRKGPVLSIDMGTCIKYDVVDAGGHYLGGGISPGLQMRFRALNHFTQKLPLVDAKNIPPLVGHNTTGSVASGVINGIKAEINGFIDQYEQEFGGIKVFLTGGDAPFFSGSLKNNIFAIPFLTLHGLNSIAQLNGIPA